MSTFLQFVQNECILLLTNRHRTSSKLLTLQVTQSLTPHPFQPLVDKTTDRTFVVPDINGCGGRLRLDLTTVTLTPLLIDSRVLSPLIPS